MIATVETAKKTIRCAIYCRKSHEEGLEQEFNSLDAQREACQAYITSQKHQGWICLPQKYEDGGFTGAGGGGYKYVAGDGFYGGFLFGCPVYFGHDTLTTKSTKVTK